MLRKTTVAAAVIAFATAGSALFGGAAMAAEDDPFYNIGGSGGDGGKVDIDCDQYGVLGNVSLLSGLGVLGQGESYSGYEQNCAGQADGGYGGEAKVDKVDKDDKKRY